jgi:hypothetical protein
VQHFVSGLDSSWPRNYMLHTITGKFLKSSYFWLLENPGCYTASHALSSTGPDLARGGHVPHTAAAMPHALLPG